MAPPRRRARTIIIPPGPATGDPLGDVQEEQEERAADQVRELIDDLTDLGDDDATIRLYREPERGGPWEYCRQITTPIPDNLLDEIKAEWGGGQFQFRVSIKGRIAANHRVKIAGRAKTPAEAASPTAAPAGDLLPVLLKQMQDASGNTSSLMLAMMQQQNAQAQNSTNMLIGMVTALAPILAGNRGESPAQLIAALSSTMQALRPPEPAAGGGLTETLAMLKEAKGLFADGGGGDGDGESTFAKLAGSFAPLMARALDQGQPAAPLALPPGPPAPRQAPAPPYPTPGAGYPQIRVPAGPGPMIRPPVDRAPPPAEPWRSDPVLSKIGDVLLFSARRELPPGAVAESILAVLEREQVPQDAVLSLMVRFQGSADWVADLAALGLDLSPRREWGAAVIAELVEQWTAAAGPDDAGGEGPSL